jgi:hypothetical protein
VSAQELEKFGQVQAELTVSFLRASQLDSPVSPLICQTAWAGTLDPSEGYEPWMAQPDEPLTGQYLFAQEIEPVVVRWFQGPGVSELQSETKPAESARSAFHFSAESEVRRRTALGVNLYLPDVDWNEWPSDSR